MTTATINLDLACELTVAMIADEAICIGEGHDDLDAFLRVRDLGALLGRLRMVRWADGAPESSDVERVAVIAASFADVEFEEDAPLRNALADKARTYLCEYREAV